jgi:hypothetical protein
LGAANIQQELCILKLSKVLGLASGHAGWGIVGVRVLEVLRSLHDDESGQNPAEYVLVAAWIDLACCPLN